MQLLKQKGFGACVALAVVCLACAAHAADTNAVQMVTYFPVPYAQYNNLYPQKKLDIGTVNGQSFALTVGDCGATGPAPFTAGAVNLRNVTGSNTPVLDMQQHFKTTTATFGNTGNNTTFNRVEFANLYLNQAIEVPQVKADTLKANSPGDIFMLKSVLPGCPSGTVKWVSLNFGTTKKYLVCCDADNPNDSCGKPCQGMEKLQATCEMTTSLPSNAPHYGKGGQVAGSWLGKNNVNNCNCNCSNVTYRAAISNQEVTGADREEPHNEADENKDYDYCVQKCWDYTNNGQGGAVKSCVESKWTNPANANDVRTIGAAWKYNNCTCDCDATSSNYENVDNYTCTHKCHSYYQNGTVSTCSAGSSKGWSWNDGGGTCQCDCGDYTIYKQSGKLCADRCVRGNPNWRDLVTKCENSNGTWRGEDGYPSCTCNCGTTSDGKSRNLVNGVCQDPPKEEEEEEEEETPSCSFTVTQIQGGDTRGSCPDMHPASSSSPCNFSCSQDKNGSTCYGEKVGVNGTACMYVKKTCSCS